MLQCTRGVQQLLRAFGKTSDLSTMFVMQSNGVSGKLAPEVQSRKQKVAVKRSWYSAPPPFIFFLIWKEIRQLCWKAHYYREMRPQLGLQTQFLGDFPSAAVQQQPTNAKCKASVRHDGERSLKPQCVNQTQAKDWGRRPGNCPASSIKSLRSLEKCGFMQKTETKASQSCCELLLCSSCCCPGSSKPLGLCLV